MSEGQDGRQFQSVADSTPAPVWMTLASGEMAFANLAFAEMTGLPRDAITGDVWLRLIHPDDLLRVGQVRAAARAAFETYTFEARFRSADGDWRHMRATSRPRFDEAGVFEGYVGLAVDVTEAYEAQARQQLLINELNHRVKNTLASVQSIVRHSLRDGMAVEQARPMLIDRLMALSAAHNILTDGHWEGADLTQLSAAAAAPFGADRFDIDGPPARLDPNTALAVAMALHVLGTNAAKYGALSSPAGRVSIGWTLHGRGKAALRWRETGGPPVSPPSRQGFGSRLLRSLLSEQAGLRFDPGGVIADMTIETLSEDAA